MTTVDVSKQFGLVVGSIFPDAGVVVTKVHGLAIGSALPDIGVTATKVHGLVVLSPAPPPLPEGSQRIFGILGA